MPLSEHSKGDCCLFVCVCFKQKTWRFIRGGHNTRARTHWQLSTCQTAVKVLFWRMWECDVVLTSLGEGLVPELRCVAKCVNLWNATVSVCECERFEWVTELTAARACVCVCVGVASFVAVCFAAAVVVVVD